MEEKQVYYEITEDGGIKATTRFPDRAVELKIGGVPYLLGVNPGYEFVQKFPKENLPKLREFVEEQRALILDRYNAAKETVTKLSHIDEVAFKELYEELKKHEKSLSKKRVANIDKFMQDFYMKVNALESMKHLEPALKSCDDQLEVLKKALN